MAVIRWADDGARRVLNAGELRDIVQEVLRLTSSKSPRLIELTLDNGDIAHLGLGLQRTVVSIMRADAIPPFPISVAPEMELKGSKEGPILSDDAVIIFDYAGSESEFLIRNTVPFDQGLSAFLYFLESGGQLSPELDWE